MSGVGVDLPAVHHLHLRAPRGVRDHEQALARAPAAGRGAPMAAPRWVTPFFAGAALLLVPWVALLVVALPSSHRAAHWDVAWAGFDVVLVLLLLTVALTAWRRSPWLEGAAAATAALLFVDAWFDILTSSTRAELVVALLEAALVELPMAVLCLLLARRAEQLLHLRTERT